VSDESDAWVNAMLEQDRDSSSAFASLDSDASSHLRNLLHTAAKRHIQLAREAGSGQGIDRHLLGLRKLVQTDAGETMPEIYEDPLYARANRWVLSTSAVFSKHFEAYGWGEVVPDGFGVAYMTGFNGEPFTMLHSTFVYSS
jgi:carnitine O-acetyltransferase